MGAVRNGHRSLWERLNVGPCRACSALHHFFSCRDMSPAPNHFSLRSAARPHRTASSRTLRAASGSAAFIWRALLGKLSLAGRPRPGERCGASASRAVRVCGPEQPRAALQLEARCVRYCGARLLAGCSRRPSHAWHWRWEGAGALSEDAQSLCRSAAWLAVGAAPPLPRRRCAYPDTKPRRAEPKPPRCSLYKRLLF